MLVQNNYNMNVVFGNKNTFLNKAKNAVNPVEKNYWESLHNEAKARLSYKKFGKAEQELSNLGDNKPLSFFKSLLKMGYRKIESAVYEVKAYNKFPSRYAEPDNFNAVVDRHYKIKENYKHLIK